MTSIDTISDLLSLSNSQYRIYDIGRKIDKISKEQFQKIELNQLPYPFPVQGNACIAITFRQKKSEQSYIWFVKLPLDERGLLNQAARNHFIAIITEALGADLSVNPTEKQEELLKANPYHFTPAQYKLAALNSLLTVELKKPASEYFIHTQEYISGKLGWGNWQNIGVQGITDLVARLSFDNNEQLLLDALPHLPEQVLYPLCAALENEKLSLALLTVLIQRIERSIDKSNQADKTQLLRALASTSQHPKTEQLVDQLFEKALLSTDDFITLAARCWLLLEKPATMMRFLEAMLKSQEQNVFSAIFKDLVAIPVIRPILFQCIRDPQRSDELSLALGQLFNLTQS
jgi:hypothetical protein